MLYQAKTFVVVVVVFSQQASKKMQGKVNMTVSFAEHPSPALDHVVHLPLGLAAAPSHPPELEGWDLLEVCPTYAVSIFPSLPLPPISVFPPLPPPKTIIK